MKLKDIMNERTVDIDQIQYELENEFYGDIAKAANSLEYASKSFDYHKKSGHMKYITADLMRGSLDKVKELEWYLSNLKKKLKSIKVER